MHYNNAWDVNMWSELCFKCITYTQPISIRWISLSCEFAHVLHVGTLWMTMHDTELIR